MSFFHTRKYKLILRGLLCLAGCFLMNSCSSSRGNQPADESIYVLSMNRMICDCVSRITGDRVKNIVLIDGAIDPHSYEMVKGDEDRMAMSQLIFCNGLGLEHSASLRKHLEGNPKVVDLGQRLLNKNCFDLLSEEGFPDPHIWTDMRVWGAAVKEMAAALIQQFPQYEEDFQKNADQILSEMEELDRWAVRSLSTIPEKNRYLVTGHNAFSYFTRRYLSSDAERVSGEWRSRCISPEGLSPEAQISIRDIMRVVEYISANDVEVVFLEDTLNQDALRKIVSCSKSGQKIRLAKSPLYSDNVCDNYFSTFQHNVRTITEELGGTVLE
ncbi:ABC transporter substrate-binding protein [Chlamydia trachomatis]|uniref:ABC transport protein, solute binding component n=2 Tax=Chlamydia trachomatis TaxID=813 RepID=A0A6H2W1A9_CHLTB|nr:zinc ABC transporter substrate-binding protein [Chlamydia trachomatis]AGJ64422.1 hypothetical protein CTLINITIAL_01710 [Chlamydia trachomatis L2/434/Bu(i)]AGJ65362.1 hypothetical protein CTLFINAL_01710 [Chlamydia trachomatis L2/434/Bu(f)]AGR93483.1 ABC transport protein, solute binding component [Chlamydia trachomatis RC-F/69]AGR94407.1 ABC transport protein, solute binding component [Chlamydia trachomatis RC-L2(s)/46]AGR96285.1 ABC transport protein, solute binding component [Chlamydia tra